jgi:hypothetical protein
MMEDLSRAKIRDTQLGGCEKSKFSFVVLSNCYPNSRFGVETALPPAIVLAEPCNRAAQLARATRRVQCRRERVRQNDKQGRLC